MQGRHEKPLSAFSKSKKFELPQSFRNVSRPKELYRDDGQTNHQEEDNTASPNSEKDFLRLMASYLGIQIIENSDSKDLDL